MKSTHRARKLPVIVGRGAVAAAVATVVGLTNAGSAGAAPPATWDQGVTYQLNSTIYSPSGRFAVVFSKPSNGVIIQIDLYKSPHLHCAQWGSPGGTTMRYDGAHLNVYNSRGGVTASLSGSGQNVNITNAGNFYVGQRLVHGCA